MHNECRMREIPGLVIIPPTPESIIPKAPIDNPANRRAAPVFAKEPVSDLTRKTGFPVTNSNHNSNEDCSFRKLYRGEKDPHIDIDVTREIADAFDGMVSEEPSDADSILVVLDAANIGYSYGNKLGRTCRHFSAVGVLIAVEYFQRIGISVKAFLPASYINGKHAPHENGDVKILDDLMVSSILSVVPSCEADDPYIITHARDHNGFVVSNDRFRDHIESIQNESVQKSLTLLLDDNRCGYTFVGDEFMINPVSELHKTTTTRLLAGTLIGHEAMQIATAPSTLYHPSPRERLVTPCSDEDRASLVALSAAVDALFSAGRYSELRFVLLARASLSLGLGRSTDALADLTALVQRLDPQNAEAHAMLNRFSFNSLATQARLS